VIATWLREHWSIENAVHWVRNVTFDEDRSTVRTSTAPQVMASLRNTALNLHRLAGSDNILRETMRGGSTAAGCLFQLTAHLERRVSPSFATADSCGLGSLLSASSTNSSFTTWASVSTCLQRQPVPKLYPGR